MLGAIIGDIVGSIYEFDNIKTKNFNLFSNKIKVFIGFILSNMVIKFYVVIIIIFILNIYFISY